MKYEKSNDGTSLRLILDKKMTAVTADEVERALYGQLVGVKNFTVDMKDLVYISSAGLRFLLNAQKYINSNGGFMTIENIAPEIMEIFQTTGFNEVLDIKN